MPTEALLDTRFAALPRLIRDATNPNASAADVRHFMDELLQADPALFAGALQFFSREGHGFVLVRHLGGPIANARTWPRWPLRRLFAARRASLITNPFDSQEALAVPFSVGSQRHVVVAPLSVQTRDVPQQIFLDALQSATVPQPPAASANERVPRFVWLGAHASLAERVGAIVRARGWPLVFAPTFGHVLIMLERDQVDVALLEATSLNSELGSLRALRHAAKIGDAPIVYFTDTDPGSEIQTLVDCVLRTNALEGDLVRALKTTASLVSRMRTNALRASVESMEFQLRACTDYAELAQTCAEGARMLGADAVSVMLADENGGVHASHVPFGTLLGDHWPTPFMTGESITHTHVAEAFFDEAFDDGEYARRVQALHPVSGAAMPIRSGANIVGTLLAFSTRRAMFQPEFDALTELCELTGRVLLTLREPLLRSVPWHHATFGETMVEVFEGATARSSVCARTDGRCAVVVLLEPEDDRRALSIAETVLLDPHRDLRELVAAFKEDSRGIAIAVVEHDERLHYACEGVPVPLRVPVSGPVAPSRRADRCAAGSLPLDAQSATLLCCNEFVSQIETANLVGAVQRGLRTSRATVARSIPRLAQNTQKLAFACVTMLWSDVASPRPPALV